MNTKNFLEGLNPEQRKAVLHKEGPLLVLAGAGSGKTKVVTSRIAYLIDQGIHPSSILAVTFTNKAALEMSHRISSMLCSHVTPLICTFHSLGVKMLREIIHYLGYSKDFVIYDEEDSIKILKQVMQSLNLSTEQTAVKEAKQAISKAKNQLLSPEEYREDALDMLKKTQLIYEHYQQRLKSANACDFDDLLFLPTSLIQQHSDVRSYITEKWSYLLIDEYQDTNYAQYRLSKLLSEKSKNIFVVGDPDQSIYSWRGAHLGNILKFEEDFPGALVIRLEENYRSRKRILEVSNAVIQHNLNRYEKNLWSSQPEGEKITFFAGETEVQEAYFVTQKITQLHQQQCIPLKEFAIFYRTNFQSRCFEDALLRAKIPYRIIGGFSFYQRKEIKDLLSFLYLIVCDHHPIAFARAAHLLAQGVGETSLKNLQEEAFHHRIPIFTWCSNHLHQSSLSAKRIEAIKEFVSIIQGLREKKQLSLEELVLHIVSSTKYLTILEKDQESYQEKKENINAFIAKAAEWSKSTPTGSITEFLEELALNTSEHDSLEEDKVNLMTLHHGKGLEFKVAFLVGMEEDLFPHINAKEYYQLEEERRLCYVGMTRAKEKLFLTASKSRYLWGTYRKMRPSRFLKEIPQKHLEAYG